jgi:NADPH-dependent ferric siderophore reductase
MGFLSRIATVDTVTRVEAGFRLIELRGEDLRGAQWSPGQKIEVRLGVFTSRCYTPISWDTENGSLRILAHLHGRAPGADWVAHAAAGDIWQLTGPKRSLDLSGLRRPAVFFGDETSIGLAASLAATAAGLEGIQFMFEANQRAPAQGVLEAFGLRNATVFERRPGDVYLGPLTAGLDVAMSRSQIEHYVFSGKAPSIQRLTRHLKRRGVRSSQLKVRAYWAPGKTGLD